MKGKQHYHSLDGLRGLAALSVVLLHYVTAFTPFLIGYAVTQRHTRLDHLISTTPLQLPIAGSFAVCIFFVLSGFVLSVSFFKRGQDSSILASSAVRRYFRLMIPAFGSVMLAYLALHGGLIYAHQAAVYSESSNWLTTFWNFPAQFGQAVFQGFYGIWFGTYDTLTSYNIVLWTMHFELFGSFLVFMFLALFGKLSNRWLFYSVFMVLTMQTYYFGFVAGMAIADVFLTQPQLKEKLTPRLMWAVLPISIVLGTWAESTIYSSVYSHITVPFFNAIQLALFAHMIGAVLLILAVLRLEVLGRFLSSRPLQYLGKVSFALYLVHFIIMATVACFIFYHAVPVIGYKLALVVTWLVGMPLTFAAATAYTRWVDVPSILWSKQIGNALLGENLLTKPQFKRQLRRARRLFRNQTPTTELIAEETV